MEFLSMVAELFGVEESELSLETEYGSVPEWDSLMHLRLVAEVEEQYDVSIPIDKIPKLKTLKQFYEYIQK